MKANEIQIGDLLYYKGQFNAFPFKVESITKKKVGYHAEPNEHRMHYLRLSECKPIPLVPEILEKNGFKEYNGLYRLDIAKGVFVNADFESKEPFVSVNNTCYFVTPICWYLHQLQHALRLCGIEKEIIL
jgi:hypothetical protein